MDDQRLVDSVKFLLKSVRQLSDHFVETNDNVSRSFESVRQDVSDLSDRLEKIEQDLQNWRDQELIGADGPRREPELPVRGDSAEALIPALNLPLAGLLDVYRNTPALLQPFARPCSVSGRTLSGAIEEIELEVFAQGTTWMIPSQTSHQGLQSVEYSPRSGNHFEIRRRCLCAGLLLVSLLGKASLGNGVHTCGITGEGVTRPGHDQSERYQQQQAIHNHEKARPHLCFTLPHTNRHVWLD